MKKRKSLTSKMISRIIIIFIVCIALLITVSTVSSGISVLNETLGKIKESTFKEKEKINAWLTNQTEYVSAVAANLSFTQDYTESEIAPSFQAHVDNHSSFFSMYIGFPDGSASFNDYWVPDDDWIPYERDWYKGAAASSPGIFISPIYTDSDTGNLCATISTTFIDSRNPGSIGVVAADIFLDTISEIVLDSEIEKGAFSFITDNNGNILVHPEKKYLPKYDAFTDDDILQNISEIEKGIFSNIWKNSENKVINIKGVDGVSRYYASCVIPSTGWVLFSAVPVSVVHSPIYNLLFMIIPIAAAFIIILSFVGLNTIKSTDKILKPAVVNLKRATGNITHAVSNLSRTANDVSHSGTEQAAAIEETSAAMRQNADAAERNTENTRNALRLTNEASENAADGEKKMANLINYMNELSKSSHEISNVINTISGIASQTNILALNASVESARAGEAGKAFAVVSEEVRVLAQKCNEAVKSTSAIIETNATLTEMGIKNSQKAAEVFENISDKIVKVNQIVKEITFAGEEQSGSARIIHNALSEMEKLTQSNAASSQESAAVVSELEAQTVTLENLLENINNLIGVTQR